MEQWQYFKLDIPPGVIKDRTDYSIAGPAFSDVSNVRWILGKPNQIGGKSQVSVSTTITGIPRKFYSWIDTANNRKYAIGTTDKIYISNDNDITTWSDETPQGTTGLGNDDADFRSGWGRGTWNEGSWGRPLDKTSDISDVSQWNMMNYGEDLIAFPTGGEIFYYDLSDEKISELNTISGASHVPDRANVGILTSPDRILLLGGTFEFQSGARTIDNETYDEMLLRWSDRDNPGEFDASNDQNASSFIKLAHGTKIIGMIQTRSEVIISTDTSIYRATYGGRTIGFVPDPISPNSGSWISQNSAVDVNGTLFWWGEDNFYLYDGVVREIPNNPNRHYIFDDLNYSQRNKIHAWHNEAYSEIWWFYPTANAGECDKVAIFDYINATWTFSDLSGSAMILNSNENIGWDSDNRLYNFDDKSESITCSLETSPIELGNGEVRLFIDRIIPDFNVNSGFWNMTIYGYNYPEDDDYEWEVNFTSDNSKFDLGKTARYIKIIFYSNDETDFELGTFRIRMQPDSEE